MAGGWWQQEQAGASGASGACRLLGQKQAASAFVSGAGMVAADGAKKMPLGVSWGLGERGLDLAFAAQVC